MRRDFSMIGTTVPGGFLYIVALLNAAVFVGVWRLFRRMRNGIRDCCALRVGVAAAQTNAIGDGDGVSLR
jgi:high-affinity nickel permease